MSNSSIANSALDIIHYSIAPLLFAVGSGFVVVCFFVVVVFAYISYSLCHSLIS